MSSELDRESSMTQVYDHPILTDVQQRILFGHLRQESPLAAVLQDQNFVTTITEEGRERWGNVLLRSEAVEDLIANCNFRLVNAIARSYDGKCSLALPDRINAGNIGLLRAIRGFDPDRETKFSSYAVWLIAKAIDKEEQVFSGVRATTQRDLVALYRIESAFRDVFNRDATIKELGQQALANTPLSSFRIDNGLDLLQRRRGKEPLYLGQELVNDTTVDIEKIALDHFDDQEAREEIDRAMQQLSEEERIVIQGAFGLNSIEKTTEELAAELNRDPLDIEEIKKRSLLKLQGGVSIVPQDHLIKIAPPVKVGSENGWVIYTLADGERVHLTQRQAMVKDLLEAGYSQAEIAKMHGIKKQAVSAWVKRLRAMGVMPGLDQDQRTEIDWGNVYDQVEKLVNQGNIISQIPEQLGLSRHTVRRIISELTQEGKIVRPGSDTKIKRTAKSEETELVREYLEKNMGYSYEDRFRVMFTAQKN